MTLRQKLPHLHYARMMGILVVFVTGGILHLAAQVPTAPTNAVPGGAATSITNSIASINLLTYRVGPGDKLSFRIEEDRDNAMARSILLVTPGGEVELPFLGRFMVAGKSLPQLTKEIKELLEKDYYHHATVRLALEDVAPKIPSGTGPAIVVKLKQIRVVGAVRRQGYQEIPADEKYMLSQAILKADGFTSFADGKKVRVIRKKTEGGSTEQVVNVNSILIDGKIENDIELQPDDTVIVKESFFKGF